jgi:hypothetical protein
VMALYKRLFVTEKFNVVGSCRIIHLYESYRQKYMNKFYNILCDTVVCPEGYECDGTVQTFVRNRKI